MPGCWGAEGSAGGLFRCIHHRRKGTKELGGPRRLLCWSVTTVKCLEAKTGPAWDQDHGQDRATVLVPQSTGVALRNSALPRLALVDIWTCRGQAKNMEGLSRGQATGTHIPLPCPGASQLLCPEH